MRYFPFRTGRFLVLSLLLACAPASSWAPAAGGATDDGWTAERQRALPSWSVLVLRLVSATHVEPTTGVVVSRSGLVLVPIDFARPGEEIVVLDGGKDIVRHGRPARTVERFPEAGVAVIEVPGLSRVPPKVRSADFKADETVVLAAFPPAELIAEGALPVFAESKVVAKAKNDGMGIADDHPLPNLTGPLMDACGALVGYSRSEGIQSLDTDRHPQYLWVAELQHSLTAVNAALESADCGAADTETNVNVVPDEPVAESEPDKPEPPSTDSEMEPRTESGSDNLEPTQVQEPEDQLPAEPEQLDTGDTPEDETPEPLAGEVEAAGSEAGAEPGVGDSESAIPGATEEPGLPGWLIVLVVFAVAAVAWFGVRYLRRGGGEPSEDASVAQAAPEIPQADPEAAQALARRVHAGGTRDEPQLRLSGSFGDGAPLAIRRQIPGESLRLLIGDENADLEINDPSISPRHAVLEAMMGVGPSRTTLGDLGSEHGTSINGIACFKGEIMYIEPGDEITLGNVKFTFTIEGLDENRDETLPQGSARDPDES